MHAGDLENVQDVPGKLAQNFAQCARRARPPRSCSSLALAHIENFGRDAYSAACWPARSRASQQANEEEAESGHPMGGQGRSRKGGGNGYGLAGASLPMSR
jgi:hypothetical protein